MISLVGYTGFVGSNLALQKKFDNVYNSKNIGEAFGTNPDLLVYSGVRAEMFLANSNPQADFEIILDAIENIKKIAPKKVVLISTVAVYDNAFGVDENTKIDTENLTAYGKNRLHLENWVAENFEDYLIVRLPAIYGENLKKNFIFDIIQRTPAMLKEAKFLELCEKDDFIKDYYVKQDNGFYKCTNSKICRNYFEQIGFSALNFTDSRSIYQFYNLKYLSAHIDWALEKNIKLLNIATEPVSTKEVYDYLYNQDFENPVANQPFNYDMKTIHFENGYIFDKQFCLKDIKDFIDERVD